MLNLRIFYGSQTGVAKDASMKLYFQSQNLSNIVNSSLNPFNSLVIPSDNMEDIYVFFCSTTGQGDPPENMNIFWNQIMKKSQKKAKIKFCVFGFGDSSYSQYNFVAKKIYRRLLQLCGQPLLPLELADDQNVYGVDEKFIPWLKTFWNMLGEQINISNCYEICSLTQKVSIFDYQYIDKYDCYEEIKLSDNLKYFHLESNERVTSNDHFQDTRLLSFSKSNNDEYISGSVMVIFPQNSQEDIDSFFEATSIAKDLFLKLSILDKSFNLPELFCDGICSSSNLVRHLFDLNSVPRKSFFEHFANLSQHEIEKERLMELSSLTSIDELHEYCFVHKRTILEVMTDFPNTSKNMTLNDWINTLPFIRPREYSIASSAQAHEVINLLVAKVEYKTKIHKMRKGLCSNYLTNLKSGDQVIAFIKTGTLKEINKVLPLILITPGTGIAAVRGLIFDKCIESKIVLFFGNRYHNKDFYFSKELENLNNAGKIKLFTAFSREDNIYVQHKLKQESKYLCELLLNYNAQVVICGRSQQMPDDIQDAFCKILESEGGLSSSESLNYINKMKRNFRYQLETWS